MPMTRAEKLDYVEAGLRGYELLAKPTRVGEDGWIALKLSCTEAEARKLINAVRTRAVRRNAGPKVRP